jgi:hypothetical protein
LSISGPRITVSSEEDEHALCNYPVFNGEENISSMTHQLSGSGSVESGGFCPDVIATACLSDTETRREKLSRMETSMFIPLERKVLKLRGKTAL